MYHHFKGNKLNRSEKIQKQVIECILGSKIPNEERENSIEWELKHSSSCIQIARMLAEKRALSVELAEVIAALHDIYAIETGSYENHARKGAQIARKILEESKDFSKNEIELITHAIANHSDKNIYSDEKYAELAKDFDTMDCFLYDKNIYGEKEPKIRKEYFRRVIGLRKEFGLPEDSFFREQLEALQ